MLGFDDVSVAFDGRPVLSQISFELPSGRVLRVTGPNGAGKSTLLKTVLGLVPLDSGRVLGVSGRRLSAVFQEDRLCPWLSAVGNLSLVAPGLARSEIEDRLWRLGLDVPVARRLVRHLSGGQQRRVAIARALAVSSEVICLDEPFTGIDAASLPAVIAEVVAGVADKDVLLVTHDDAQAQAFHPVTLSLVRR